METKNSFEYMKPILQMVLENFAIYLQKSKIRFIFLNFQNTLFKRYQRT